MKKRKKLAFAGLTILLTLVTGLTFGELFVRWFLPTDEKGRTELTGDPILFYQLVPGVHGEEMGSPYSHSSQHIRGSQLFGSTPPPGVGRVLWVGDSACYGLGVTDEQTAPHQFGTLAGDNDVPIESINLGVVGYNVRQVREVVCQRSKHFSGAAVVVYYHHENDIVNATWAGIAALIPKPLRKYEQPQGAVKQLLKRSALVQRLARTQTIASFLVSQSGQSRPSTISPFSRMCLSLYNDNNRWGRQFRRELYDIADEAHALGAQFLVVYWPTQTTLGHPDSERARAIFHDWCNVPRIELVDVTEAFRSHEGPELYVDATHPGPEGQRIIAGHVWSALRNGRAPSLGDDD